MIFHRALPRSAILFLSRDVDVCVSHSSHMVYSVEMDISHCLVLQSSRVNAHNESCVQGYKS